MPFTVQKEFAGTESKSETEKLLRQAMEDYEAKRFIAKADNITFNPMQYVVMRRRTETPKLFAEEEDADNGNVNPLSNEMYLKLIQQFGKRIGDAILPVQIAYFTGLRLGEVCGLTWQDIWGCADEHLAKSQKGTA